MQAIKSPMGAKLVSETQKSSQSEQKQHDCIVIHVSIGKLTLRPVISVVYEAE